MSVKGQDDQLLKSKCEKRREQEERMNPDIIAIEITIDEATSVENIDTLVSYLRRK